MFSSRCFQSGSMVAPHQRALSADARIGRPPTITLRDCYVNAERLPLLTLLEHSIEILNSMGYSIRSQFSSCDGTGKPWTTGSLSRVAGAARCSDGEPCSVPDGKRTTLCTARSDKIIQSSRSPSARRLWQIPPTPNGGKCYSLDEGNVKNGGVGRSKSQTIQHAS